MTRAEAEGRERVAETIFIESGKQAALHPPMAWGDASENLKNKYRIVADSVLSLPADPDPARLATVALADLSGNFNSDTFASVISFLIREAFDRVETLNPEADHRYFLQCKLCGGTDEMRPIKGSRPAIDLVTHGGACSLAEHLHRLRALADLGEAPTVSASAMSRAVDALQGEITGWHERVAAAIEQAERDARARAIEKCARMVEEGQETHTSSGTEERRHLSPRRHGNLAGLAYAEAIRALADGEAQDDWQPIEAAPIIYGSGADVLLTDGVRQWVGCLVIDPEGRRCWQTDGGKFVAPTHWRPLPAPPTSREGE